MLIAEPATSPQTPLASDDLSAAQLAGLLALMYRIRYLEETLDELFAQGRVHGTMHLSIGQEAAAAGAISALRASDYLLSTHRGHGHMLAKGADPRLLLAEFLGRDAGYCHGLGGSMHMAAIDVGHLGANGIVGGGISIAVGVALALQMRGDDRVVLDNFGDGASNEGGFHEALNLASVWQLPVVFVCENNQYGMSMSVRKATHVDDLAQRAIAYGMPGAKIDGNDVLAVRRATRVAVERARNGGGPSLLELVTYRWKGHSKSDQNRYRTAEEINWWKRRDPIAAFRARLIATQTLTDDKADAIAQQERATVAAALTYAEACPEPGFERLLECVYA